MSPARSVADSAAADAGASIVADASATAMSTRRKRRPARAGWAVGLASRGRG